MNLSILATEAFLGTTFQIHHFHTSPWRWSKETGGLIRSCLIKDDSSGRAQAGMPGSRLSVDPAEEPPGGGGTAAVLVSCALSLSLIICFLLVVVFWRKNAHDPEGRRVPAEEDNGERFVQAPQALHAPLVQGDLAEPRVRPQAPAPSWPRITLTSSNFSHFHTCQMCLERPRSVLTLPCR